MKRAVYCLIVSCCMCGLLSCAPQRVVEEKRIAGFSRPESVLYDGKRDRLYVSNVNGAPTTHDGNGFVSLMRLDGEIIEREWATALDAPKGMALWDGYLYVTDIDRLVVIDCETGDILETYPAADAEFLNDIAIDENGIVYVSDMYTNRIYALQDETLTLFLQTPELENPNGLTIVGDELIVACWGAMEPDWSTEVPGHLKAVHLTTKEIRDIGQTPVGNLDGLEVTGRGTYLVTDYMIGALYEVTETGEARQLLDCERGSADHEYLPEKKVVIIPLMESDEVAFYRFSDV